MLATGGRYQATASTERPGNNDIIGNYEAERKLGNTMAMGSMGLTAMYPVALNNPGRLANFYNSSAKNLINAGKGVEMFSKYKNMLGITNPVFGRATAGATTSPRNILNTGLDIASFANPVTGILNLANKTTVDEDDPYGTVPVVSDIAEFVGGIGDDLNESAVGQGIKKVTGAIHDATIGPVMRSDPGKFFYNLAKIPLSFAQGVVNATSEAYEAIDRTLFNNYLPGGANPDKPETMEYNESFDVFMQDLENLKDKVTLSDKEKYFKQYEKTFGNTIGAEDHYGGYLNAIALNEKYEKDPPLYYKDHPDRAPEGQYYNPKVHALLPIPEGYEKDPNLFKSEDGVVPAQEGKVYDPEVGIFFNLTEGPVDPTVAIFDEEPIETPGDPILASLDPTATQPVRDPTVNIDHSIRDFGFREFIDIRPQPTFERGGYIMSPGMRF